MPETRQYVLQTTIGGDTAIRSVCAAHDAEYLAQIGAKLMTHELIRSFSIVVATTDATARVQRETTTWNLLQNALRSYVYGINEEPITADDDDIRRVQTAIKELRETVENANRAK